MQVHHTSSAYPKRPLPISAVGIVKSLEVATPLLCRKDAARYLGVEPQTLAQWACSGKMALPYVKIGRKVAYRKVDIDAFITANTHGRVNHVAGVNLV